MKKREILPYLQNAIIKLSNMSVEAAKLEMQDNDTVSRKFKQDLVDFEHFELGKLKEISKGIRDTINNQTKIRKSNKINQTLKTKEQ